MKNNKNNITYLIITYVFLISNLINAQFLKRPDDIKSPDAASLGKYGDLPVSHAYGTVDVNVPLYTMNSISMPLNISLNYDTSGLKINSPSGTVGTNWSLSTGGVITRSIQGQPDENICMGPAMIYDSNGNPENFGYFYRYNYLNNSNWNTYNFLVPYIYTESVPQRFFDTQPDIFTFNFMGHSGKFFLGQDGIWKVQSDSNLEIIINESDFTIPLNFNSVDYNGYTRKSFGKITIKDDSGNLYTFGSSQNSIEYTCLDFYYQSPKNTLPSSWYIDSVKDRLGNTLYSFSYERGKPIAFLDSTKRSIGVTAGGPTDMIICMYDDTGTYFRGMGSLISPVYLSSINSREESLQFQYSDSNSLKYKNEQDLINTYTYGNGNNDLSVGGSFFWHDKLTLLTSNFHLDMVNAPSNSAYLSNWNQVNELLKWKKLDTIRINKNYGTIVKRISFQYIENPNIRLFLNSINIEGLISSDSSLQNNLSYSFEYNNLDNLPKYLWKGVDHWGYYNTTYNIEGYSSNNYFIARESSDHPYFAYLKTMGMLKKINYPTGGFSEFEFESNDYSNYQDFSGSQILLLPAGEYKKKTGGLRIKNIFNVSNENSIETINYQYTSALNSDVSSGILEYKPKYYSTDWTIYNNGSSSSVFHETSTNAIIPLTNFSGSHILYNKVFEKRTNQNETYYTEYNYTDHSLYPDINYIATAQVSHSIFDSHISKSFMRGKLLSKKYFNSQNQLLKSNEFIYRNDTDFNNLKVRSIDIKRYTCADEENFNSPILFPVGVYYIFFGNAYEIYYGDFDVIKEITKEYRNGNVNVIETDYDKQDFPYMNNGNNIFSGSRRLYETSSVNSKGENISNQLTYQYNCGANQNCYDSPFGLIKSSKDYNGTSLLFQEDITYIPLNSDPKSLVVENVKKVKSGNIDGEKINFSSYDAYGNIIEYYHDNGIYTVFIYDHTGNDVLGKIENARYTDLTSYLPEITKTYSTSSSEAVLYSADPIAYFNARDVAIRVAFNQMRNNLPNSMITSYTYDVSHRLKSMTSPNGYVEFYFYDGLDRLVKVTDKDGNILKAHEYHFKN